jgi:hypothetical protein
MSNLEKKVIYKVLNDSIYGAQIHFFANIEMQDMIDRLNRIYKNCIREITTNNQFVGCFGSIENKNDERVGYFLWCKNFDWSVESQGTMVHELFHMTTWILNDRGMALSRESEEAYTYHLEYWFKTIWNILKNYETKKENKNAGKNAGKA